MLVTDAEGIILWRDGAAKLLHAADSAGLAPGTQMSEEAIGTNAMGTTLAVDAPVQIHSAEHLVRTYHAWTCAASPVHDPDTGAMLAPRHSGPWRHASARSSWSRHAPAARTSWGGPAIADERLRRRTPPCSTCADRQARGHPERRIIAGEPYALACRVECRPSPTGLLRTARSGGRPRRGIPLRR